MQGKLNEIDMRSILQLIELGQRTGEMFVEAYTPTNNINSVTSAYVQPENSAKPGKFWLLFLINGQIAYAGSGDRHLQRLRDYLRPYKAEAALEKLESQELAATNTPEYAYLWALIENHCLTPAEARNIIQNMVQETLFDLLSLHQGSFIFEIAPALAPQLTTIEIAPLVLKVMKQVQEWKQFIPHIQSPNQCVTIANVEKLNTALPANAFNTLEKWADGKTSLRQLARYLNRDVLVVARAIYPYVQQGWLQLSSINEEPVNIEEWGIRQVTQEPKIVCIDDDVTIGKTVEYILQEHGYKVTTLSNSLEALSLVFQIKPDLILCDIAMPELDGYEICAMLRKSTAFRLAPIVMLTGMDGFIDRVRARMVGATDYLTKPFGESELLMLIEKYLKNN